MTANIFSDAMGEISEKYIMEAVSYQPKKKHIIWPRVRSAAACFLLAVLLTGTAILTFSVEARAAFFGWVREQYETFYSYFFEGDVVNAEPANYELGVLPDGYTFAAQYEIQGGKVYIYTSQNGSIADFSYSTDSEGFYLLADAAECAHHAVTVNGMTGDLYITPDEETANMLVWMDSAKGLFFSISAPISGDELLELAKEVKVNETNP